MEEVDDGEVLLLSAAVVLYTTQKEEALWIVASGQRTFTLWFNKFLTDEKQLIT